MYWWVGIVSLCLMVAPWVMGYSADQWALWSNVVLGLVGLCAACWTAFAKDSGVWEYWTTVCAGVVAAICPWVFGYSANATATWSSVVVGLVLVCVAAYAVLRPKAESGQTKAAR